MIKSQQDGIIIDDTFSLEETQGEELTSMMDTSNASAAVSDQFATDKAAKVHLALKDASPGAPALKRGMVNREDNFIRNELASTMAANRELKALNTVQTYIDTKEQSGEPLSPEMIARLVKRSQEDTDDLLANPDAFFEKLYAKDVMDRTFAQERREENEVDLTESVIRTGETTITKYEGFAKIQAEIAKKWEDSGLFSSALNYAGTMTPFLSWWNVATTGDEDVPSVLQGSNVRDRVIKLWNNPNPDEALKEAQEWVSDVASRSTLDALYIANAILSYSQTERVIDDLFSAVDVASVVPVTAVARRTRAMTRRAMGKKGPITTQDVNTVKGEVAEAGYEKAVKDYEKKVEQTAPSVPTAQEFTETVPSLFDVSKVVRTGDELLDDGVKAYASRVEGVLKAQAGQLVEAFQTNRVNLPRLTPSMRLIAQESAQAEIRRLYPKAEDAIFSVEPRMANDSPSGLDTMVVSMGRPDGTLFESATQANMFGKNFYGINEKGFSVVENSSGKFHIEIKHNVDETAPSVKNFMSTTTNQERPYISAFNGVFGYLRSKDNILPKALVQNMKLATTAPNAYLRLQSQVAQSLRSLSKDSTQKLADFTKAQQRYVDPKDPEVVGKFSNTLTEFAKDWRDQFKTAPTEAETAAYFTLRQFNDIEYIVNNLNIWRAKVRKGLKTFSIRSRTTDQRTFSTPELEGKQIDRIPWEENKNTGLLVIGDTLDDTFARRKDYFPLKSRESIEELVNSGQYRIIQLSPTGEKALRGVPELEGTLKNKGDISFVIAKNTSAGELPLRQLPYRPGGHILYPKGFFVKQPIIRKTTNAGGRQENIYDGDITLFRFNTRNEAKVFEDKMEYARSLLADRTRRKELNKFIKEELPMTPKEFFVLFSKKGPFSKDIKFSVTGVDERVSDVTDMSSLPGFINRFDSPYNLYDDVTLRFASERGQIVDTVGNIGTPSKPIWNVEPTDVIDPARAIDLAGQRAIQSQYMDPLKLQAGDEFVSAFKEVLDLTDPRYKDNNILALLEAPFKETTTNKTLLKNARQFRRSSKEFFGQRTTVHQAFDSMKTSVVDEIVKRRGIQGKDIPNWLLLSEKDPVTALRAFAFHTKLGLWNPIQLIQQAQSWFHIAGITNPVIAGQAGAAAFYTRKAFLNPDLLPHVAKRMEEFGMKRDEFLEMFDTMKKSGWAEVGREIAQFDDVFDTATFTAGGVQTTLDGGTVFFRESERWTRLTAWHVAYRQWKDLNNGRKLDDTGIAEVLNRADILTNNMTRASNASWNTGLPSIPTQFFSWHARLADQVLSFGPNKSLTGYEKAKLLTMYSTIYGVPVGAAAGVSIAWPFHEEIRKGLERNGVDVEASTIAEFFRDGLGAAMIEWGTEVDTNFGERMGPSGNPFFKDILRGEKSVYEMFGGVSGSTVLEAAATTMPFIKSLVTAIVDDTTYPTLTEDALRMASTVSSVNVGRNVYNAIALNKIMTKNGDTVTDVDAFTGSLLAISGLQKQDVSDMYLKIEMNRDLKAHKEAYGKEFTKNYRRYLRAFADGDMDTAETMLRNVQTAYRMGMFQPHELHRLIREISQNEGSGMLDNIEHRWSQKTLEAHRLFFNRLRRKEGNN